jgi:hypothetical protein
MRSFALWYIPNEQLGPIDRANEGIVDLHINLWKKTTKKRENYCFDFGLRVKNISTTESIKLYCPFPFEANSIRDLGSVISNNKLTNAIFNESYKTTEGDPKRLNVKSAENEFIIYTLDTNSQVALTSCKRSNEKPGTIIDIKIADIQVGEIKDYYFRIRVEVPSSDVHLINDEIDGVSIFSNQFTNTEVIDFRINDIRSCSDSLREQFEKGTPLKFRSIHYLILRNASDLAIFHGNELGSRMLESDLWKGYIDNEDQNLIAYHFKKKSKTSKTSGVPAEKIDYITDFSTLARFQYKKNTASIIAVYLVILIALGAIGGVCGNYATKYIENITASETRSTATEGEK